MTDFAGHFLVHCPKCDGRALVRAGDHRLLCTSCHHSEMPGHWYGAWRLSTSRHCTVCGHQERRSIITDRFREKLPMRCAECGDEREYTAHSSHVLTDKGLVTDSVFGLPLWLQAEFKGELFWAFNTEHLAYIRQYVAAKLRERGIWPGSKNASLISRLPAFLKKAGHREALLRLFDELEKR